MSNKIEYRLAFGSYINVETANNLRAQICNVLARDDFGDLIIMFSSDGGDTDQSIALFNFINRLPVPVRMHAIGHVGNTAIPVFLAAKNRTAEPSARFFFHEYDWGFVGRQTLNRIDEALKRLRSDIETAQEIIKARTNVPADVLKSIDGGAASSLITVDQAKSFGLINDICSIRETGRDGMKVAVLAA